ncbi:MAG: GNAT family N-acetyltransferase [Thermoplasmata archaeon]
MTSNVSALLKDGRTALIRRAVPGDAEGATELVNIVGAEKKFTLRERATWTLDEERRTLTAARPDEGAFFVAEIGGELCGLLNIERGKWPKNRHVASFGMALLPNSRRIGLGTGLLRAAIEWARSAGVRKLTLEVFSTNVGAIQLYQKMGFLEEGRLARQFIIEGTPVDSILMALWIS